MNGRWWAAIAGVIIGAGVVGCAGNSGSDDDDDDGGSGGLTLSADRVRCEVLCEEAYARGCADFDHGQCIKGCVDAEDFIEETTECESTFQSFLSCLENQSYICDTLYDPDLPTTEPACNDQAVGYAECLVDYCADNPSKDWCELP